ncbi:MAG: EAL domain-containing protein [Deltaproteobacteria bacterium]|nr:EAL domain-containing protein [Deltaproteobacteria bacterium]
MLDLKDNRIHHYEVLARLREAGGEVLLPSAFIDIAERFGLIGAIDRMIIEKALRKQASAVAGGRRISFSINLSGRDMEDASLLQFLKATIAETGAAPGLIIFEITETAAIGDLGDAKRFVGMLKSLGCRFALDDFGVGFTSFAYLRELQADYIKIDGSFIKKLHDNEHDRVFVKAMTEMAKGLGIKTIAEFVEEEETVKLLKKFGVDYAQGYLIGKPMPDIL